MRNFFIIVQIEKNDKWYAHVVKASESDNLVSKLNIDGLVTASICKTKKEAGRLMDMYNEEFKRSERYMFQNAPLF